MLAGLQRAAILGAEGGPDARVRSADITRGVAFREDVAGK
jgi:hypothetical protein